MCPNTIWVDGAETDACFFLLLLFSRSAVFASDPYKTVTFYRDLFNMEILSGRDFSDFSLFFMGSGNSTDSKNSKIKFDPALELTWNHGTEKEEGRSYHDGNDTSEGKPRGFGHIGFLVNDLNETCRLLEQVGVEFIKKPNEGSMKTLAFAKDPSGWWIEIIQRGFVDTFSQKKSSAGESKV